MTRPPTFTGNLELRDGPNFGQVSGSWERPHRLSTENDQPYRGRTYSLRDSGRVLNVEPPASRQMSGIVLSDVLLGALHVLGAAIVLLIAGWFVFVAFLLAWGAH